MVNQSTDQDRNTLVGCLALFAAVVLLSCCGGIAFSIGAQLMDGMMGW